MDKGFSTKVLLEAAYLTAISAMFAVMGFYLPLLMGITAFISVVPVVVLLVRTNGRVTLISLLVGYILLVIFIGNISFATITFASYAFAGIAIGWGLKNKWSFVSLLTATVGAYILFMLFAVLIMNGVTKSNYINEQIAQIISQFDESFRRMNDVLKENPALGVDKLQSGAIEQMINNLKYVISLLLPGSFITSALFLGYIALSLSKMILGRIGYDFKYLPVFSELRSSKSMVFVFAISSLTSFSLGEVNPGGGFTIWYAFPNIFIILGAILMVTGLSLFDYYVKKAGIPGAARIIIYIAIFVCLFFISLLGTIIFPLLGYIIYPVHILIMVALVDSMFNFRKLGTMTNQEKG